MAALTPRGPGDPRFTDPRHLILTRTSLLCRFAVGRQGHPNNWRKHCKKRRQHAGVNPRLGASWELTTRTRCERCDGGQHRVCRRLRHCFARERSPRGTNKRRNGALAGRGLARRVRPSPHHTPAYRHYALRFCHLLTPLVLLYAERAANKLKKADAIMDRIRDDPHMPDPDLQLSVASGMLLAAADVLLDFHEESEDEGEGNEPDDQADAPPDPPLGPGDTGGNGGGGGGFGGGAAPIAIAA